MRISTLPRILDRLPRRLALPFVIVVAVVPSLLLPASAAADRWNPNAQLGGPAVDITVFPSMVLVPEVRLNNGDLVYYARSLNQADLYVAGDTWYLFDRGHWYTSGSYHGPWNHMDVTGVPRQVVEAPSGYYHFDRNGAAVYAGDYDNSGSPSDADLGGSNSNAVVRTDAYGRTTTMRHTYIRRSVTRHHTRLGRLVRHHHHPRHHRRHRH